MTTDLRVIKLSCKAEEILSFFENNRDHFAMANITGLISEGQKIPACKVCRGDFFVTVKNFNQHEIKLPNGNLSLSIGCDFYSCEFYQVENIICNFNQALILESGKKMVKAWRNLNKKKAKNESTET